MMAFGGYDELIAKRLKVSGQNAAKILFGRAIGRPIIIRQIKVSDALVESVTQNGTTCFIDIFAAKVFPKAKGNCGKANARIAAFSV